MMPASSPFFGLCLLMLFLNTPSSQALAGPVASCCLKTQDAKAPLGRLVSYHMQNAVCAVEAVQIKTVLGITICSDPSSPWAQRAMRYLDGKKLTKTATPLMSTA
nr:eotaxin-like [Paramormyrops kingsleyae]